MYQKEVYGYISEIYNGRVRSACARWSRNVKSKKVRKRGNLFVWNFFRGERTETDGNQKELSQGTRH